MKLDGASAIIPPLLTLREAATFLRRRPVSLYRLKKRIPHIQLNGRILFRGTELERFLREREVRAAGFALCLPAVRDTIDLDKFDRLHLKVSSKGGRCAVSGKARRWNYGFGAVYMRPTKKGFDRWYLDYRDGKGKRRREAVKQARTRGEAVIALERRIGEVFSGRFNPQGNSERVTFAEFSKMFLEGYAKKVKTSWKTDEFRLNKIKPFFEGVVVGEIGESKVLDFREARLKKGISRLTANREIALLKKMFSWAVEKGLVNKNPARKVKMFSERDTARDRVLFPEEEERLFGALTAELKPLVFMVLHTGLRLQEALSVAWSSIDFERKRIKVERTKSKRARFVTINSALAAELETLKKWQPAKTRLVFPFERRTVRTGFENACREAGVERFTFHDLRRTFGTRLLERGVDIVTIQKLYGHSSVLVTQNYLHPGDELAQEAVERLVEAPKKPQSLSQICHTARERAVRQPVIRDFSVN